MKNQYNKTIAACFTGYIVQAIVNNFVPLLFLIFQRQYEIPLEKITMLITINFTLEKHGEKINLDKFYEGRHSAKQLLH
jgi:hypothetical protein